MKKVISSFLFFLLLICVFNPIKGHAEGTLHLEADIGIENRVKYEAPTVLNITVTNNGEAFSGDFVVDNLINYSIGSGIVLPVDLAPGETKTIPIFLSGFNSDYYAYNQKPNNIFSFYEGGIEKGKLVKHEGDKTVTPRMMGHLSKIAIILTSRQDEVRAFEDLRKPLGDELYTYYTNSKNDPYLATDADGLAGIDLIIFDDIALNDLSKEQQSAIYQWVQQGGTVVFSPTQNPNLTAGILKDVLPLTYTGQSLNVPKDVLKNYINYDATQDEIALLEATINEGSMPSLQLDGYTLAASTNVGRGNVIQFAFPLYDPIITKFNGYGLILKNSLKIDTTNMDYLPYFNLSRANEWRYINELFETFNINTGVLVVGILIYMLIAGPVLYFFLKRKDKREKMWFAIPIFAVITSLAIFIVGAKDRIFSPQVQSMALYEVTEDGTLNGIFNNAVLSNRSGEFAFEMDTNTKAMGGSVDNADLQNLHKKSYYKETANGGELVLRDFGYWSVQTVAGQTVLPEGGQLITELTLSNQQLTGTIQNKLAVDLQDVKILSGTSEFDVGTIKAGEVIDVSIDTKKTYLSAPRSYSNYYGYTNTNSNFDLQKEQLALLKETAITSTSNRNAPVIVGWSDISLAPITLKGGSKQNAISYFVKTIEVDTKLSSEVLLSNEDFITVLTPNDVSTWGHIEDEKNGLAYISEGEIPLYYELRPNELVKGINWTALEIKYDSEKYNLAIKNQMTGERIELKDGKFATSEQVEQYLIEGQKIELFIERHMHYYDGQVKIPTITLKGEPLK